MKSMPFQLMRANNNTNNNDDNKKAYSSPAPSLKLPLKKERQQNSIIILEFMYPFKIKVLDNYLGTSATVTVVSLVHFSRAPGLGRG